MGSSLGNGALTVREEVLRDVFRKAVKHHDATVTTRAGSWPHRSRRAPVLTLLDDLAKEGMASYSRT
jgi:hypothetical protein